MYSFGCNHTPDTERHSCFLKRPIKKWLLVVRVIHLPVSRTMGITYCIRIIYFS